jgi:hypothetical protein
MDGEFHRAADAALARRDVAGAITALEQGLADLPGDFPGWMKLAALRRNAGRIDAALAAANVALDIQPNDFMALLLKGSLHEQLAQPQRAAELYRAILADADDMGPLPPPVVAQLDRVRAFLIRYRADIEARIGVAAIADGRHAARASRFIDNVLDRRPVHHQAPTHYRYPGLPDVEFFDFAHAAMRERLRRAFPEILAEFGALLQAHADRQRPYVDLLPGQPVGQWSALNRSTDWNALHLIRYGEPDPLNAATCPRTMAAFAGEEQADIPGLGPNLMFSLLAPHTHIPPHHGVGNFRVVCHLPLIVPANCRFRVGADIRVWQPGEPWIFDDTIEHEAWNDSDELRVVLIGDLWRPELDAEDRGIVRDFMTAQAVSGNFGAL